MARDKKQKIQEKLRNELNEGRGLYSKKKLITIILLCCLSMALPLPYIVQIPLLIYFGLCIKKSRLDNGAQDWLNNIDKYIIVIWTVATIAYTGLYVINLIKFGYITYDAFVRLFPNLKSIGWTIPMCIRYPIIQYVGLNEFMSAMQTDALSTSEIWRILSDYEFVAFSSNYIGTGKETTIQFNSLVSPLSMLIRLNKVKSLPTITGTAWVLLITRFYYWLKSRKHKA